MAVNINASTSTGVGIASDNSGILQFQSNGTNTVQIAASGNVGIGTASPGFPLDVAGNVRFGNSANARLRVTNTSGTASDFYIGADSGQSWAGSVGNVPIYFTTNNTERMRIDSSGNVGIGTASPQGLLHVDNGVFISRRYANPGISILQRADGTQSSPTQISSSSEIGYIPARGLDELSSYREIGFIKFVSDSSISSTSSPGYIVFGTTSSGSVNPVGRMRIDSSGNLLFNSGYGSAAVAYGCRAWITFNGSTASPTINGSGNITSITDNGIADYTLNFTNSFPDTNYSFVGFGRWYNDSFAGILVSARNTSAKTSSACRIIGSNSSTGNVAAADPTEINVAVFR